MEKRIGTITVFVTDRSVTPQINGTLSQHAELIAARQGLPFRDRSVAVISLIVEGDMDEINQLSGKLGRIGGVEVKTVVSKAK
jgi:putative iron-only hydrogenase system regulator